MSLPLSQPAAPIHSYSDFFLNLKTEQFKTSQGALHHKARKNCKLGQSQYKHFFQKWSVAYIFPDLFMSKHYFRLLLSLWLKKKQVREGLYEYFPRNVI